MRYLVEKVLEVCQTQKTNTLLSKWKEIKHVKFWLKTSNLRGVP